MTDRRPLQARPAWQGQATLEGQQELALGPQQASLSLGLPTGPGLRAWAPGLLSLPPWVSSGLVLRHSEKQLPVPGSGPCKSHAAYAGWEGPRALLQVGMGTVPRPLPPPELCAARWPLEATPGPPLAQPPALSPPQQAKATHRICMPSASFRITCACAPGSARSSAPWEP